MSVACRACGHIDEGDPDFCPNCGEYLRWDPTGHQQAVPAAQPAAPAAPPPAPGAPPAAPAAGAPQGQAAPPPPAPPPPAAAPAPEPAQPEAVLIALRRPDDEGYASEPLALFVEPGGAVVLRALVRNQSGIVDNYDMAVAGLPEGWWQVAPATVYLVPFGAAGGSYEEEVEVRLAPPRSAEAEARDWEIAVVATSRAHGTEVQSPSATLEIGPYSEIETALTPERRSGRLEATFSLGVTNRANAPVEVDLSGVDAEQKLGFAFREPWAPRAKRTRDPTDRAAGAYHQAEALGVGRAGVEEIGMKAVQRATAGAEGKIVRFLRNRKKVGREISGLRLEPGEKVESTVTVSPPKQIWIGRGVMHPFQVVVQPAGTDVPGPPVAGTFRQRQWLPWWLLILIPLIVIGVIWFLSTRAETVTVPDLAAAPDVFGAESLLKEAGLVTGEKFEEQDLEAAPGTIIEQTPAAGESVEKGSAVSLKVAVGDAKVEVPDLTGKTQVEAGQLLKESSLQLGRALSEPADPATATVAESIPAAGTRQAEGSAIDVVFAEAEGGPPPAATPPTPVPAAAPAPAAPPPPPATPSTEASTEAPPTPTTATPGATSPTTPGTAAPGAPATVPTPAPPDPGSGIRVPQLVGTPEQQAAAAVASAGLVPSTVLVLSDQPPGTVVAQDPAPDTEVASGGTVVLSVSRGSAELILSSAGDLVREGANGLEPVFQSAEIEEQPNASPATRLIAFRRGREGSIPGVAVSGQIWVIDPADPRTTYPLTNKGFDDRWPAISPDGRVVAFTSNRGGNPEDYDLCFVGIEEREAVPRCVADRDFAISRPAWSPDGRTIVARANQGETQVELVQYNSAVPSSGSQADWLAAGFVTDSMHGDRRGDVVLSSAFSPDGTRLAFAANWRDGTFKLYLAPFQNGVLGQAEPVTVVAACELAWRPDGVQIAVSQRSTDCSDKGRVVRLDLATPTTQQVVTPLGPDSGDPAWAFLG